MSRPKGSQNKDSNEVKVVRVTKTEFELSDGRIYQHPFEFTEAPTLQAFRQHYRNAKAMVLDLMAKQDKAVATAKSKPDKPKEKNE